MSEAIVTSIVIGFVCLGPFAGGMLVDWLRHRREARHERG